jgi:glycosyltransferase involved in cell wall biosynthesis
MTVVVTVSEYWRRELQRVGCPWVEVIYNSFDTVEFDIDMPEADATVRKYGLPTDRPLVYIGNTGRGKGVEDVYAALKDAPFALFMTGNEPDKRLPVPCFNLERREYLCLLEASSVVLTMSRKLEGWTRVAHEAMMCESPVIGTGSGGLLELLQAGGQIVHPGAAGLREAGEAAMARRAELGSRGRAYAETLNLTYFNNAWVRLVTTLLSTKRATSPAGSLAKVADAD